MKIPCCDECVYESPEEHMTNDHSDYYWEYYCNLADGRKIDIDENELCPQWCPLLKEEKMKIINDKQMEAFRKAVKERGEQALDFIDQDGFIIPIIKNTGEVVGNLTRVSITEKHDDVPKMILKINVIRKSKEERLKHKIIPVPGNDELGYCEICRGAKGELPTDCPGRKMSIVEKDAIYNIGCDFKDGKWISTIDHLESFEFKAIEP